MNTSHNTFFIIFIFLLTIVPVHAQDEIPLKTSNYFEAPLIGRNYIAPPIGQGSPYLYDNWLKGYVVYSTGDTVKNKLFKFDCFKNEFIWMSDGKSLIALDHNLITSFALFPSVGPIRKFEKTSLKLPLISDTLVRYLEVLSEGKVNLFAFRKIAVYSESTIGGSGGLYQLNSYEAEPVYFIQIGEHPVKQIRFIKKNLIDAYPEYSAMLKKILRENHYGSIRNEYQLTQAINLINANWN